MQGDGAVVAQLAHGDGHPLPVTDANDGVGLEVAQLAGATTGPGQQFDHQAIAGIGSSAGGAHVRFLEGLDTAVAESETVSIVLAVAGG
jgi:molybdopterin converting factor small subunit